MTSHSFLPWGRRLAVFAILLLTFFRLSDGLSHNGLTFDEPYHLDFAASFRDSGVFSSEDEQPALTRRLFSGTGWQPVPEHVYDASYTTPLYKGRYVTIFLHLSMLLAFYVLVARSLGPSGPAIAVVALFLLALEPSLLAHAGLATTDSPLVLAFVLLVFSTIALLKTPSVGRAVVLGLCLGLTMATKHSGLFFWGTGLAIYLGAGLLWRWPLAWGSYLRALPAAAVACAFTIWAIYGFDIGPILTADHRELLLRASAGRFFEGPVRHLADIDVPASEFFHSLASTLEHSQKGHRNYFLGQISASGHALYFPVAFLLKTLPATLLLFAAGLWTLAREPKTGQLRVDLFCIAVFLGIFLIAMPANINIGVRHVLPAYPVFAVVGAVGFLAFWRAGLWRRLVAVVLLAWALVSSATAHPTYIPYFNSLALGRPAEFLIDSNLDWGQGTPQLYDTVARRGIQKVYVTLFGFRIPEASPRSEVIDATHCAQKTGWIAVGITHLMLTPKCQWLRSHTPVEVMGKSIHLYEIP